MLRQEDSTTELHPQLPLWSLIATSTAPFVAFNIWRILRLGRRMELGLNIAGFCQSWPSFSSSENTSRIRVFVQKVLSCK